MIDNIENAPEVVDIENQIQDVREKIIKFEETIDVDQEKDVSDIHSDINVSKNNLSKYLGHTTRD